MSRFKTSSKDAWGARTSVFGQALVGPQFCIQSQREASSWRTSEGRVGGPIFRDAKDGEIKICRQWLGTSLVIRL